MNGFYFHTPQKEFFFVTNQTKKTRALCEKISAKLSERDCRYRGTFGTFELKDMLLLGTCETKHTEKFGDYFDIKGNGWGGCGSFVNDGKTEIVYI